MRAGRLRHYVAVEQPVTQVAADGGATKGWELVFNEWAAIEPLRGREYFQAAAAQSEVDTMITMRYRSGVKTRMRVNYAGRHFDIQAVKDIQLRGRELQIMAKEYQT
jgi:SPP1 family predicted phage head-tail adaptor